MNSRREPTRAAPGERLLSRWMIGMAVSYLHLLANFAWLKLAPSRLDTFHLTSDRTTTSVTSRTTSDPHLMSGLDLAVIADVLHAVILVTGYLAYPNPTGAPETADGGARSR